MRVPVTLLSLLCCLWLTPASAASLRVAVASSFVPAMQALLPDIRAQLGLEVELVSGASGMLAAQISEGAPFDLFLSADEARAQALVSDNKAIPSSLVRYTRGALVLWSARPSHEPLGPDALQLEQGRLAIANPALAPYGEAAVTVLQRLAPQHSLQLITGNSVGQAFHFAWSGNADLALVAHAQVLALPEQERGARWAVPQDQYPPLYQAAVIPSASTAAKDARRLLAWLREPAQQARLVALGYLPLEPETHD